MRLSRLSFLCLTAVATLVTAAPASAGTDSHPGRAPVASTGSVLLAGPTPSAIGTHLTTVEAAPIVRGSVELRVTWGFDYNPATNNLRAYTYMWTNSATTHLQTEPLRLGDRNGVLKDKYFNTQNGLLETETDPVSCHKPSGVYRSRVYFSVRWPDGVVTRFVTDILELGASQICV